jgi:hypothetical protein
MKYSTFKAQSITPETRKTLLVQNFLGLDLSNDKMNVNSHRAVASLNYMYRDGLVQKRYGFSEIAKFDAISYVSLDNYSKNIHTVAKNTTKVNGVWTFLAEDGKEHTIAHIGKLLFEMAGFDTDRPTISVIYDVKHDSNSESPVCREYLDQKSQAFVGGNKLWFLGGTKYMVIRCRGGVTTCEPVEESSLAYVPTTMSVITYTNATSQSRAGLDYPNMLTEWRKNLLLSGTGRTQSKDDGTQVDDYEYVLDVPIVCNDLIADLKKMEVTIKYRKPVE